MPSSSPPSFVPSFILLQITALTSLSYVLHILLLQLNYLLFGTPLSLSRIFSSQYLDVATAAGWGSNIFVIMSSLLTAVLLSLIVGKSKKCLDFTLTTFLLHVIFSIAHSGFPKTWDWWIVHAIGVATTACAGEWLCSRRELADIPSLLG